MSHVPRNMPIANGYRVFGGTTAQWAEHDDLLHYREMGIEFTSDGRVLMKFGVWTEGDVGTPWSRLPYSSGPAGPSPEFEWQGTSARFKNPDGSWGDWVNLQGPRGPQGEKGAEGPIATSVIPATRTTLGGVLVGSTLEVTPEGCLDVKQGVVPRPAASAPRAPGAAEVGTSTQYAREDHRHPAQTTITGNAATATTAQNATTAETCTGNAATATRLQNARTLSVTLTGDITGSGSATFNGTANAQIQIATTEAGGGSGRFAPMPQKGTGIGQVRAINGATSSSTGKAFLPEGGTWLVITISSSIVRDNSEGGGASDSISNAFGVGFYAGGSEIRPPVVAWRIS